MEKGMETFATWFVIIFTSVFVISVVVMILKSNEIGSKSEDYDSGATYDHKFEQQFQFPIH